jgi:hypothetical protein
VLNVFHEKLKTYSKYNEIIILLLRFFGLKKEVVIIILVRLLFRYYISFTQTIYNEFYLEHELRLQLFFNITHVLWTGLTAQ